MRRVQFVNEEYYHVYNRGVEKRVIYPQNADYVRFLFYLQECNDQHPLVNGGFYYRGLASLTEVRKRAKRIPMVDILCFCLMPNHFHLLLRQREANGISKFLQKVGTAYTMYFNMKYQRTGALFQGLFKAIHIPHDRYFLPLTRYIHLNPLDLMQPGWKEHGIRTPKRAHQFLRDYAWSSYPEYVTTARFPELLNTQLIREMFKTMAAYTTYVQSWRRRDLSPIVNLIMEVSPR